LQKINKTVPYLGLGTLIFFGLGGALIVEHIQDKSFSALLREGMELPYQLLYGVFVGLAGSAIALLLITRKFFKREKVYYAGLIARLELGWVGMVFLSLCAGIGEEIFFRAGIQPLLGVWWTAIIFVGLHGYLNPKNIRISIYGTILVGVIAIFGYLFEYVGIYSAITAHVLFDLVLFVYLNNKEMGSRSGF